MIAPYQLTTIRNSDEKSAPSKRMRFLIATGLSLMTLVSLPAIVRAQSQSQIPDQTPSQISDEEPVLFTRDALIQLIFEQRAKPLAVTQQAIAQNPNSAEAHRQLAMSLQKDEGIDSLLAIREALYLEPDNVFTHYSLSFVGASPDELFLSNTYSLDLDPRPDYFAMSAWSILSYEIKQNATSFFHQDGSLETIEAAAFFLCLRGDFAAAEILYREIIRRAPADFLVDEMVQIKLERLANENKEDSDYVNPVTPAFRKVSALQKLGDVLRYQGKFQAAEEAYREAMTQQEAFVARWGRPLLHELAFEPSDALLHNRLGNTLRDQGDYAAAETYYRRAIALDADYHFAHYNLAQILYDSGRAEAAAVAYEKSVSLYPPGPDYDRREARFNQPFSYVGLGYLAQQQGRLQSAADFYRRAIAQQPNNITAQNNLTEVSRLIALESSSPSTLAEEQNWQSERTDSLQRAVVRVATPTPEGMKYATGWVVKREGDRLWILTSRYGVTAVPELFGLGLFSKGHLSDEVAVDFFSEPPPGHTQLRLPAETIEVNDIEEGGGFALLSVDNAPVDIQPLAIASGHLYRGEDHQFRLIGHREVPWQTDTVRTESIYDGGFVGSIHNHFTVTDALMTDTLMDNAQDSDADDDNYRGFGSPVLDDHNQVVGMDMHGSVYPASYLHELLARWNVL